jgi:hypothetical protein
LLNLEWWEDLEGKEEQLEEQHLVEDSIASAHINNATWTTNTTEQRFDNSA